MIIKLLVLICALFVAPKVFAEEGGVRGDTLIVCVGGLIPVTKLYKGIEVWTMSEKGRVRSPISGVKSYPERFLVGITLEGTDKDGIKRTVEIVGAPSQRLFCPNRQEWVKFCELDQRFDLACINFCEPVHITKISEYSPFFFKRRVDVYSFEVAKYGMFFASELLVPLHNCDPVTLTLGAYALGFSIEFLIACASSLVVIGAVNELDKLRGIKRHDEIDDNVKDLLKKLNKAQADKLAVANTPEQVVDANNAQKSTQSDESVKDKVIGCGQPQDELKNVPKGCGQPTELTGKGQVLSQPIPEPQKPLILGNPIEKPEVPITCGGVSFEGPELPTPFACDNHGGATVGQAISAGSQPATEADIVGESLLDAVKEYTTIFVKYGCNYDGAVTDSARLQLPDATVKPGNKGTTVIVGTDESGSKVVTRSNSKDGRATLEFQHTDGTVTKIRYEPLVQRRIQNND